MKYIKSVEDFLEKNLVTKYKSGDIVLVNSNVLELDNVHMRLNGFNGEYWVTNKLFNDNQFYLITNDEIVRKLSDKEIEDLKIDIESKRYNL
jgi:hypothetical protein